MLNGLKWSTAAPRALTDLNLVICYKNFAAFQGISHIGLGVSAMNNVKVLQKIGVRARVVPLKSDDDLKTFMSKNEDVTHVVVSAPWLKTATYSQLCALYPDTQFALNCHSNVGFLSADSNGIKLMREAIDLEAGTFNFHLAGNSQRFVRFIEDGYGMPCSYLPNMYYLNHLSEAPRPLWSTVGGVLRIGAFGATRTLKNFLSCIGAAIEISRDLKAQTEIWVNSERNDGPESNRIRQAGAELVANLPNLKIQNAPWAPWPSFRKVVGSMHLGLQVSFTESFNMVTADMVAEGIPSVVSDSIYWAPQHWQATADDVNEIARIGVALLNDPRAGQDGLRALKSYNSQALDAWLSYLLADNFGNDVPLI